MNEQLENLQAEIEALRKAVRVMDETMVNLKKEMVTLHAEHDELEQYTRRNSVRLTGLTEATNENVYDIVMTIFNEEMGVSPPISPQEIDRIHRVGKPDPTKKHSILIKFATYRSKKKSSDKPPIPEPNEEGRERSRSRYRQHEQRLQPESDDNDNPDRQKSVHKRRSNKEATRTTISLQTNEEIQKDRRLLVH